MVVINANLERIYKIDSLDSLWNFFTFVAILFLAKKARIIDCTLIIFFTCVSYNLREERHNIWNNKWRTAHSSFYLPR